MKRANRVTATVLAAAAAAGCYSGAKVAMPATTSGPVTLPMLLDPDYPADVIVEVNVAGVDAPLFFSVQPNQSVSWVSLHVMRAGGFPKFSSPSYHGTGWLFGYTRLPSVLVGGIEIREHTWAISPLEEPLWSQVSGAIGSDVLRNLDFVIDRHAGTVSFYPKGDAPPRGTMVPVRLRGSGLPIVEMTLPGGPTVHLGLATSFENTEVLKETPGVSGTPIRWRVRGGSVATDYSTIERRAYRVELRLTKRIAGARVGTVELPPFDLMLLPDAFPGPYKAMEGHLGGGELAHFRTTVSLSRGAMWLEPWKGAYPRRMSISERLLAAGKERLAADVNDALGNWFVGSLTPWLIRPDEADGALALLAERYTGEGAYARAYGRMAAHLGRPDESETRLARAVMDVGPDYTPVAVAEAEALVRLGRHDEAIARAGAVIDANGGAGSWSKLWIPVGRKHAILERAHVAKSLAHYSKGELDAAREAARDAIKTIGDYVPGRLLLGRIYLTSKELEFAADQYSFLLDVVGFPPNDVMDAYAEFGRMADLEPVLAKLREESAKTGSSLEYDRALGLLHREMGSPARAAEDFNRAVGAATVSLMQGIQLAYVLALDLGRVDDALKKVDELRRDYPEAELFLDLLPFETPAFLRGATRGSYAVGPGTGTPWHAELSLAEVEADLLFAAGRNEMAVAAAERALALWPQAGGALDVKARALVRLGRHEESLAILRELVSVDEAGNLFDDTRDLWVYALRALGRMDEANVIGRSWVAAAREELAVSSGSSDARSRLAIALAWSGGDIAEAHKLAEDAERLRPGSILPKIAAGEVALARGDAVRAREAAASALAIVPWDPWARWIAERAK